ncbi:MAG: shikimate kinase [Candidatus Izemoplasmatales bacterium]|nr:shikimate kinase [Candidatus Izemoplasmatales bacterium]
MNRIMIVGSPGSGKSTLSKMLSQKLGYPILHLDKIYHIDNKNSISKEELKDRIAKFVETNEFFLIDGNYGSTMEYRMQFVDTVIILDINTNICLENIEKRRLSNELRSDMAEGFDNSTFDDEFIEFVKSFRNNNLPKIKLLLSKYNYLQQIYLKSYKAIENFALSLG